MTSFVVSLVIAQHAGHAMPSALDAVAQIHGEAGPWAVAGYRMGDFALKQLGLKPHSHQLRVTHKSPKSPQFACVADGAQAATGASVGTLSLAFEEAKEADIETVFVNTATGASLTLRPAKTFVARFTNAPREKAKENGAIVLALPQADVFDVVTARDAGR